jgi:twitching motility protein PilT
MPDGPGRDSHLRPAAASLVHSNPPQQPYGNEHPALPRAPRVAWEPPPWESLPRKGETSAPLPTRIPLRPVEPPAPSAPPHGQPHAPPNAAPPNAAPPAQAPPPQRNEAPMIAPLPQIDVAQTVSDASIAPPRSPAQPTDLAETSRFAALTPRHKVEAWLAAMCKNGASDLILRAAGRPSMRIDGRIGFLPGRVPAAGALLEVIEGVVGRDRMTIWNQRGSVDAALQLDGLGRFRLNAYKQMGEPALVVRRISDQAPQLERLELPTQDLVKIAMRKRGLVLVTGIAGSGKSTTLAGMIEHMNQNAERHVITLEDPIEVLFTEKRCVISQREVGIDCDSFHEGLRHALRQSPDVIQIGEMRDRETVSAALDAAETGHLVMSTLHTVNAAQTLDRILGFFPAEQHGQVRTRLSDNMACVLSQRLVPRATGKGMVPAFELMAQNPRVRELIEQGETGELMRTIEQGATPGLISFNQSLRRLVQQKLVELKDALAASDRPDELVLALRGITSSSGRSRGEGNAAASQPPKTPGE